jgi:hypothetical protein
MISLQICPKRSRMKTRTQNTRVSISSSEFSSLEDIPCLTLTIGSEIVGAAGGVFKVDVLPLYATILWRVALGADTAGPDDAYTVRR